MRTLIAMLCLAVAGCTLSPSEQAVIARHRADDRREVEKTLAGLVPVETNDCLDLVQVRSASSQIYGSTVLYRVSNDYVYRTDTQGDCGGVGIDNTLITSTPTGRLCRGDIGRSVDRVTGAPAGTCIFGAFTTYRHR